MASLANEHTWMFSSQRNRAVDQQYFETEGTNVTRTEVHVITSVISHYSYAKAAYHIVLIEWKVTHNCKHACT